MGRKAKASDAVSGLPEEAPPMLRTFAEFPEEFFSVPVQDGHGHGELLSFKVHGLVKGEIKNALDGPNGDHFGNQSDFLRFCVMVGLGFVHGSNLAATNMSQIRMLAKATAKSELMHASRSALESVREEVQNIRQYGGQDDDVRRYLEEILCCVEGMNGYVRRHHYLEMERSYGNVMRECEALTRRLDALKEEYDGSGG